MHAKQWAITGASGYVGGHLLRRVLDAGHRARSLSRNPPDRAGAEHVTYDLGGEIETSILSDVDVLVHAAYDAAPSRKRRLRHNVEGARRLFAAAAGAGVKRILYISSIAAHAPARSLYARTKLACECIAREAGAIIVRPALIHGYGGGPAYARMERIIRRLPILPIPASDAALFTCHIDDLNTFLLELADTERPGTGIYIAACEEAMTFLDVVTEIRQSLGLRHPLLRIPWRLPWLAARTAELAHLPCPYSSDSILGIAEATACPDFSATRTCHTRFRTFRQALALTTLERAGSGSAPERSPE